MNRQSRLIGLLLLAPAVLAGGATSVVEGWRLARPRAAWFAPPETHTIADAIAQHDVARAHALLRQLQSPDDLIVVRHPVLTSDEERFVSPLWWAVAMQDEHAVMMLIEAGATVQRTKGRDADCLAASLGRTAILGLLRQYAAAPDGACPPPDDTATPPRAQVSAAKN